MKKILVYIIVTATANMLFSCKKYLDINQNPNGASEPPINGLLAKFPENRLQSTEIVVRLLQEITEIHLQEKS